MLVEVPVAACYAFTHALWGVCVLITQHRAVPALGLVVPVISVMLLTGTESKELLSECTCGVHCCSLLFAMSILCSFTMVSKQI